MSRPPNEATIFTFWEPAGKMSPYLRLCLRTWETNLTGYRIVVLNRGNVADHLDRGTYDGATLESLSLPMQKDAIMVAVLEKNGGVFMDVDTLVFRDVSALVRRLDESEAVMFGMHTAFLAARPGAEVLTRWRAGIQAKLRSVAATGRPPAELRWDYLGNSELQIALETANDEAPDREPVAARALAAATRVARGLQRRPWSAPLRRSLDRIEGTLTRRRLVRLVRGPLRSHLTLLDPRRSGYIAETAHFRSRRLSTRRRYERFWFEDDLDVATVTALDPVVVGLHNSWTPPWFSGLSEDEVLGGRCLLSRTLRHLLPG